MADYLCSLHDVASAGATQASLAPLSAVPIDLFNIMVASLLGEDAVVTPEETLLATLRMYIEANFRDPALSPSTISRLHHMSARHLYKLFANEPEGPAGLIRRPRLRAAKKDLANPVHAFRTVSAIAQANGFVELSTFNRSFMKEFGQTPTDWRKTSASS